MATTQFLTKAQMIERLREIQSQLVETVSAMPEEVFARQPAEGWSAAEYVLHLVLSVGPVGKAMNLPPEKLESLFGRPDDPSRTYDELEALYRQALANGVRAEDAPKFVPHLPDDHDDLQQHLLTQWNDNHARLFEAVERWPEAQLDDTCIGHPAFGALTVREMLYFTIFHNRLHLKDIQAFAV